MSRKWMMVGFMLLVRSPAVGQQTLDLPVGEMIPYAIDSGSIANPSIEWSVVLDHTVTVHGAAWLRLYFDAAQLPLGSTVRMTSLFDGEVQELDGDRLAEWGWTSAYFNGDAVRLELIAGPMSVENRILLGRVAFQKGMAQPRGDSSQCGICGTDDRVPSGVNSIGRLLPTGCTATVYYPTSCLVSAGHCIGSNMVVQFNVPASNGDCSLNNPPVADQFAITSFLNSNNGPGNDWSVLTTGTNGVGQKPYDRYGLYLPIATTVAGVSDPVTVTGFGADLTCTRSQTQQTSSGTINQVFSNAYTFSVDIRGGSSGSSLVKNNQIIGIVTHCPCPNTGTRIDLAAFVSARSSVCPENTPPSPAPTINTPMTATATSLQMSCTTATDPNPPVQYFFQSLGPPLGADSSGWQLSTSYLDTGLQSNTTFGYAVKARDSFIVPAETPLSATVTGVTLIETPTGITFSNVTPNSVDLEAQGTFTLLVAGQSGLFFDSTTAGGNGGLNEWVQMTTDTATGLQANALYTFRAKGRNRAAVETPYGPSNSVATLANTPAAPVLGAATTSSLQVDVAPSGNPAPTEFAIRCTATSDATWLNKYVNASGAPSATEVWRTDSAWGVTTVQPLMPQTSYTFAVKARNQANVETAFGPTAQAATLATATGACCLTGSCSQLTAANCAGSNGQYQGDNSACTPNPCSPACNLPGDVNQDGSVNGADVAGYVRAKLGSGPLPGENQACADFGGDLSSDTAAFVNVLLQ